LLIELQRFDARIQEVQGSIRALPEKLQPAKNDLAKLEALLQQEKDGLARTEQWKRDQEGTLRDEDEGIKKAKVKLQASKNSKDYAAANRELEYKRRTTSEREEELLKVIDALETTKKSVTDHEQDVAKLRAHIEEEEREIAGKVAALQAEVDAAMGERNQLAANVEKSLLKRYDLVQSRRGIAVVPVVAGACQGCHMSLPPQLVNTVARKSSIENCPRCQRLIYVESMLKEEPPATPAE
jgi:predicted  nucleic acid-binding Zn-ribbon protein